MNRREFLKVTAATAALTTFGAHIAGAADSKTYRVGITGAGWFGKLDMCRLIQVAPVEVVSVFDTDRIMADHAADCLRRAMHRTESRGFTATFARC